MIGERLILSQNERTTESIQGVFKELWNYQDFTDVTLATVDDKQIRAHKVILSSFSPFFKNILLKNSNSNLILYLKDTHFKDIEMVLKFIYFGRCEVGQEDLVKFLDIGKELQIKGLVDDVILSKNPKPEAPSPTPNPNVPANQTSTGTTTHPQHGGPYPYQQYPPTEHYQNLGYFQPPFEHIRPSYENDQPSNVNFPVQQQAMPPPEDFQIPFRNNENPFENFGDGLSVFGDRPESRVSRNDQMSKASSFPRDRPETRASSFSRASEMSVNTLVNRLNSKVQQAEVSNLSIKCDKCEGQFSSRIDLKAHMVEVHGDKKRERTRTTYACDQCSLNFTRLPNLYNHKKSEHGGGLHSCDKCEYQATQLVNLERHMKLEHTVQ